MEALVKIGKLEISFYLELSLDHPIAMGILMGQHYYFNYERYGRTYTFYSRQCTIEIKQDRMILWEITELCPNSRKHLLH